MNPVFWLIIAVMGFVVWILLSAIFIPLGKFMYHRWKRITKKINEEYEDEEERKNEIR